MSDETAEQMRSKRHSVSLSRLYLDPNNFRFVDHPEYRRSRRSAYSMRMCKGAPPTSYLDANRRTFETLSQASRRTAGLISIPSWSSV